VIPALKEFIKIPNLSPQFPGYSPECAEKAVKLLHDWVLAENVPDTEVRIVHIGQRPDGSQRTSLLLVVVEATKTTKVQNVLMYGHFDKQPPGTGWTYPHDDPYTPHEDEYGKLYGRGGADDGYAIFSLVTSIQTLNEQGILHDRYVIIIEGDEESGNGDVEAHIEDLLDVIKTPTLIVCTDSGGGTWDRLWLTNSLRGYIRGNVDVAILTEEAHSGSASGIVPSSFHIQRELMQKRLLTEDNGVVRHPLFYMYITHEMEKQARDLATLIGEDIYSGFKWVEGAGPEDHDIANLILNNTLRATLCIIGVEGIPLIDQEGKAGANVIRKNTRFQYSIRTPPETRTEDVIPKLTELLTKNAPFGAHVTVTHASGGNGWLSPPLSELGWLGTALNEASRAFFGGKDVQNQGQGGSIPLIRFLQDKYPQAKFVVSGVLGPTSNAHGPNEFLDTVYAKKVTGSIAFVLYSLANYTK
jgi:acetylornithine deacetylase/succinyl-diaminopimelate desuccinylase-like protein